MSEASAVRNAEYHKNTLAKLLEEAKQLGIDTQETDKEQNNLYQAGDYQLKQRGENDFVVTDKEGNVLSRFTPLTPSGQSDTFNDIKWAKRDADLRAKMDKEAKTKKPPDPEQLKKLAEMAEEEKNAYNSAMIELFRNGMISEKEAVAKLTGRKNRNRKTAAEARKLLGLEKPAEQKTADMDGGLFNKKNQNTEKDGGRSDFAKIRDKYQSAKAAGGDEDEIAVGKEAVSGKWKLVEADTPAASHDEQTFRKTPGFPANDDGSTINDRDYERDKAAQEAVLEIAAGYDMRALSFDSPVIVTKDGIVISGNNRTMSSKIAARKGTDKKYIEALKKKAGKFGFTEKDVAAFRNPRVVFEIDHNEGYSTEQFAKFNESGKKAMSPIESAVKVSKMIRTKTVGSIAGRIAEFETLGELYADKKAAHDIFNTLQQDGIIGQFDRPQYITDDGITGAGKEFLETVLIGSVINEQNIRGLNREGCKSIRQKLVRAITPLIENKGMDGYSITKELNEAVDIAMQVAIQKDKFKNVDDFSKQHTMFEKLNLVSVEFAKKLEETQKGFAEFMQAMNGGLKYAANGEADIFVGGVESREQILDRVLGLQKAINKAIDGALRFFRGLSKGRGSFDREKVILNRAGGNAEGFRRVMKKAKPDVMLALEKQAAAPHAELIQEAGSGEKTIAIDFDGVINSYTSGWQGPTKTDEPVLSAAEGISGLWNRGHTIIIFSTRANSPEGVETIREYLRKHTENDLLADSIEITDRKPIADVYIDDRAIPFTGNWAETLKQLEEFKPWTDKIEPMSDETVNLPDGIYEGKRFAHTIKLNNGVSFYSKIGIRCLENFAVPYQVEIISGKPYPALSKSLTYSGHPLQGQTKVHGMDISIENKKGSARSGVDKDGHEWHTKMHYDYGYIRGTVGVDKDHLDAYVGPSPESEIVYIVNQNDPVTGDFDEQKVMLGFNSEAEAKAAYLKQYDRPGFFGDIVKMDIDTFKEEAFNPGNKGKPIKRREN